MKTKVSPSVIGMFVVGAFALLLIGLLSFGSVSMFSKPQRFLVRFDESIHGLDLGSPVKLRGVRVGRVVDLSVNYDAAKNQSVVAVICEFNRDALSDSAGHAFNVSDGKAMQQLVDNGLRAQLGVLGLATGLLFVELDFRDPREYPPSSPMAGTRYVEVPSVPSAISEYQASLSEILADLKDVDFAGLSREMKGLLVDARRQVNKIEVKELIAEWTRAGQSVNALASSPELKQLIVHMDEATQDLRRTLQRLDSQIDPTATQLGETLAEAKQALATFNSTALTLRRFIGAQQNFGEGANQAFARLSEAADAVQRLADFLERNPNALLTGREKSASRPPLPVSETPTPAAP